MLCGATTATLSRRALIDFSLPVFVDGASVLFRAGGPKNFEDLAGHKIGVRAGTTTEEALGNTLEGLALNAQVRRWSALQSGYSGRALIRYRALTILLGVAAPKFVPKIGLMAPVR